VSLILLLVVLAVVGTGIGALARFVLPGKDPMPLWVMVGIGVVSAVVGGLIGYAILDILGAIVLAVGGAVGLVYLYRRWKRRKGPSTVTAAATAPPPAPATAPPAPATAPAPTPSAAPTTAPPTPVPTTTTVAPAPTPPSPPSAAPVTPAPAATGATEAQASRDRFCASCGTEFQGDERFCTNCGAPRD
jgi:uncharacterized membrane protein YeaQ/YmgE (transglycosylase-associated protein family)